MVEMIMAFSMSLLSVGGVLDIAPPSIQLIMR